jgi:hypothetical protein
MFSVCVCAFFCVCVQVVALRRADHPPKDSYRLSMIQDNQSETESFMEVDLRPTGAVVPMKKTNSFQTLVPEYINFICTGCSPSPHINFFLMRFRP